MTAKRDGIVTTKCAVTMLSVIAPENGGKGSYGDRNYRRGRGGRNDRRPKREPYVPQVAPDREQKNDAAGVSVYGKIEIKKNTEE